MVKLVIGGPFAVWVKKNSPVELETRLTVTAVTRVAGFPPASWITTVIGPPLSPAAKEGKGVRMTSWVGGMGVNVGVKLLVGVWVALFVGVSVGVFVGVLLAVFVGVWVAVKVGLSVVVFVAVFVGL